MAEASFLTFLLTGQKRQAFKWVKVVLELVFAEDWGKNEPLPIIAKKVAAVVAPGFGLEGILDCRRVVLFGGKDCCLTAIRRSEGFDGKHFIIKTAVAKLFDQLSYGLCLVDIEYQNGETFGRLCYHVFDQVIDFCLSAVLAGSEQITPLWCPCARASSRSAPL